MGHRVNAAAGGIAQGFHASNVAQRLNQGRQYRAVAGQRAVKPHLFAQVEDRCPVIAKRTADQQHVSRANLLRPPANTGRDDADPGGIDKQLIRRPARHHFGIAGDNGDAGIPRGLRHAVHHRFEGGHLQPLFENKPAGEIARQRAAHRHIVGRTAHRQLADIAAWEKQRIDDVAVGGEGEPVALRAKLGKIETRLIFLLRQPGVGESLHKQVADQLLHRLTAATVG